MIDRVRTALARRAALAAVAARPLRPLPPRPEARTLLLILPADEPGQRAAWTFVGTLDLPDRQVWPVVLGDRIGYAPDRFAGGIQAVRAEDRDWRRLPKRSVAETVWAREPDVALNLADESDLGAAFLVGASPAAVRIGRHSPETEPFYDLMIAGDASAPIAAVGHLLAQIDPPVLPLLPRADSP